MGMKANFTKRRLNATTDDEALLWLQYFGINLPIMLLGILTICANGAILVVFVRKRPLKIATNFFLVGIAFSDLLTGLVDIPIFMACNLTYRWVVGICQAQVAFSAFTSLSTIAFIATITADRYIAIMKPLRYKALVTKKRVKIIITVIWLNAMVLSLIPMIWATPGKIILTKPTEELRRADFIYTIIILCPIIMAFPFMVYAYVRIFMEIRRQLKMTHEHERLSGNGRSPLAHEFRTVCVFIVMLTGYVLCWTPFAVIRINPDILPQNAKFIVMILTFVTSFLNPCCYGFGKKDFRSALSEPSNCAGPLNRVGRRRLQERTTSC